MFMIVLPAYVCMFHMCAVLLRARRGHQVPRTKVSKCSVRKHVMLLTSELFLQLQFAGILLRFLSSIFIIEIGL